MNKRSPHLLKITVSESNGSFHVTAEPEDLRVRHTDVIRVEMTNGHPRLLFVELHVPGNSERRLMYGRRFGIPYRKDTLQIRGRSAALHIGGKAQKGPHPYKLYAHFSGSTITVETKTVGPRMIVE
jgi:hypothetical protein